MWVVGSVVPWAEHWEWTTAAYWGLNWVALLEHHLVDEMVVLTGQTMDVLMVACWVEPKVARKVQTTAALTASRWAVSTVVMMG